MGMQSIRQFFTSRLSPPEGAAHRPDAVAIAACALLLEIAHADEVFSEDERLRILRAVRRILGSRPKTWMKSSAWPKRSGARAWTSTSSRASWPRSSRASSGCV